MKVFILILATSLLSLLSFAQISSFPWHDDFSTHGNGAGTTVNGWSCSPSSSSNYYWNTTDAATPSSSTGPNDDNGGDHHYAFTEATGFYTGDIAYLISPVFDITSLLNPEIIFYYHMYGSTMGDLIVEINSGGTYTTLQTLSGQQTGGSANAWTKSTIDISAYTGLIQIRFKGVRGSGYKSDMAIDDFNIDGQPPCPGTNSETISNLTSTAVKLIWTEVGTATSWDVEYGPAGFSQGNGTSFNGLLTQHKTLNGLSNSTDYDWYVRSDCGANGNSIWQGPFSFTTHCNTIANVPWTENFDAMANVGNNIYPGNMSGDDFSTSSSNNPNREEASSGLKYIRAVGDGESDTLFSEPFHVVAGTSYDFSYKVSCPRYDKPTKVISCVTKSKTGTELTELNTANMWDLESYYQQFRATYNATENEIVYFVIINKDDNGYRSTYYDDIMVEETPSCLPPKWVDESNKVINGAKLKWEEVGAANAWQLEYNVGSDFIAGTGSADGVINVNNVQEYDISNLTHNTEVYWYVRSNCGGGSYSDWAGKGFFTTIEGEISHPVPTNGANTVAVSSRTIDWDDVAGADSYTITIGTTPGGNDVVHNVACATSEYTKPSSWNYAVTYYWTATIVYNGGQTIVGREYEFFTECEVVSSFPYTTSFENGVPEDCWFDEDVSGVNGDWSQVDIMPNFYNYPAHTGTYMAKFNSNFASATNSTRIYTPQFDFTSLTNPEVNFWMHHENSESAKDDRVQIQVNDGNGWVDVGAPVSRYRSAYGWELHFVDLSAYANQIVKVAFLGISEHGKQFYIDDVAIQEAPVCREPYSQTVSYNEQYHDRDIKWESPQGTNAWQIEYGYAGFAQGTGTIISVSSASPYHLTGLTAGGDYEWYIRTDCGSGDYSDWVGPDAFRTKQYNSDSRNGKTTKCSPTYDRLDADGSAGASAKYFYDKREFTVATTGFYDMDVSFSSRDGQIHVYQNSFDPQNPANNWLAADDGSYSMAEDMYLTAGVSYIAVAVEESPLSSGNMGNLTYTLNGAEEVAMPYNSDINGQAQAVAGNVPATNGSSRIADYQCVDVDEYTHYYDDNGTPSDYSDDNILLSVKLNGNTIGNVGDVGFEVLLAGASGVSLIETATAPYVDDAAGWYVYNRYWNLTPAQQPSSPVNVKYYYQTADFNALQSAIQAVGGTVPQLHSTTAYFKINSIIGNYNPNPENGHSGIPLATAYNTDGCWIYENGQTPETNKWSMGTYGADFYAEFKIGHFSGGGGGASPADDNGSPLPISLGSFYGFANGDFNAIKWKTLSEENTKEFIIERSSDNKNYHKIAKSDAAGNSNSIIEYEIKDDSPLMSSYYRLRTIDNDGSFSLSNTIIVNRDEASGLEITQLFPNPSAGLFTVLFRTNLSDEYNVVVTDMVGVTLFSEQVSASNGENEISIDVRDLPSGSYLLMVSNQYERVVKRIIIKR